VRRLRTAAAINRTSVVLRDSLGAGSTFSLPCSNSIDTLATRVLLSASQYHHQPGSIPRLRELRRNFAWVSLRPKYFFGCARDSFGYTSISKK
jgi:hypothetical protein